MLKEVLSGLPPSQMAEPEQIDTIYNKYVQRLNALSIPQSRKTASNFDSNMASSDDPTAGSLQRIRLPNAPQPKPDLVINLVLKVIEPQAPKPRLQSTSRQTQQGFISSYMNGIAPNVYCTCYS